MSEKEDNAPFRPDWVSIPGAHVKERLDELNILTDGDVAAFLGLTPGILRGLFAGWLIFDDTMAETLSALVGSSKQFWLNLDTNYRKDLARLEPPCTGFQAARELLRLMTERFSPGEGQHGLLPHTNPTSLLLAFRFETGFIPIELEEADLGKHPRLLADEISTMLVRHRL